MMNLCKRGGFRLSKWICNDKTVLNSIPEEERVTEVKDIDLDRDHIPLERALGVAWNVEEDVFGFQVTLKNKAVTKRGILSVISSVYDPLEFLAPYVATGKLVACHQLWLKWLDGLKQMENINVSRCIKPKTFGKIEKKHNFIIFVMPVTKDMEPMVTYLLMTNVKGHKHVTFLMGKARVASLKQITIPRMELAAAVLALHKRIET